MHTCGLRRANARAQHSDTLLQRRRRGRGGTHRGATRIRRYASVTSSASTARTAASTIFGHWSPHHCRSNLVPLKLQLRIVVRAPPGSGPRSEEHTSELQSQSNLVCRLLLEKKKKEPDRVTHELFITDDTERAVI